MKKEDKILIVILLNDLILSDNHIEYLNKIQKHSYNNVHYIAFYFDKKYVNNNNFSEFNKKIKTEYISDFSYKKLIDRIKKIDFDYVYFAHYSEYLSIDALRLSMSYSSNFDMAAFDIIDNGYYYNLSPLQNSADVLSNLKEFYNNIGMIYSSYSNISYKLYCHKIINKLDLTNVIDDYTFTYQLYKNSSKLFNVKNGFSICNFKKYFCDCINFEKKKYEKQLLNLLNDTSNDFKMVLFGASKVSNNNNNCFYSLLNQYDLSDIQLYLRKEKYFHHLEKVEDSFFLYENIKEKICSENIKIVSFDIFDTLILRPFIKPTDLFCFLDIKFNKLYPNSNYIYFSKIRQKSEEECRRLYTIPGNEEITLKIIYDFIQENYSFDKQLINELMNYEQELEYNFCYARESGKELYSLANYLDKDIICLSDIYLSYDLIDKILKKNGYNNISDLRLSSVSKKLKCTGSSYSLLKNEYNDFSSILHIGDNFTTDVETAKKCDIKAMHIPNVSHCARNSLWYSNMYYSCDNYDYRNSEDFLGNRIIMGLVANKLYDYPYFNSAYDTIYGMSIKQLGTIALALSVLGNCIDIHNISEKNDYEKKVFLARDGYLLFNAYKILYPNEKIDYLYTSRNVLLPLSIQNKIDFYSLLYSNQNIPLSPERIFNIFNNHLKTQKSEYMKIVSRNGYNYSKYLNDNELLKFLNIVLPLYDFKKSNQFKELARNYYSEIIQKKSALIDIGYSGRAESIFTNLLGYPVNSIYIHSKLSLPYDRAKKCDFKINTLLPNFPKISGSIREYIYSSTEPSCVSIDYAKKKIVLDIIKIDSTEKYVIHCLQNYSLQLIKDFYDRFKNYINEIIFDTKSLERLLEEYFYSPKIKDAHIFDIASFEDKINILDHPNVNMFDIWIQSIERYKNIDKTIREYITPEIRIENKKSIKAITKTGVKKVFYPFYRIYKNKVGSIIAEKLDENNMVLNNQFQLLKNENEQLKNTIKSLDKKIDYLINKKDGE